MPPLCAAVRCSIVLAPPKTNSWYASLCSPWHCLEVNGHFYVPVALPPHLPRGRSPRHPLTKCFGHQILSGCAVTTERSCSRLRTIILPIFESLYWPTPYNWSWILIEHFPGCNSYNHLCWRTSSCVNFLPYIMTMVKPSNPIYSNRSFSSSLCRAHPLRVRFSQITILLYRVFQKVSLILRFGEVTLL